jgi:hypothetical protein
LSEPEFDILLRGEQASGEQDLRAAACGVLATAIAGLIGIHLTVTMKQITDRGTTVIMLYYGLWSVFVASIVVIALTTIRLRMIKHDPIYQKLIDKIRDKHKQQL